MSGCGFEDFGSVLDPSENENCCSWEHLGACRGGVDNQLPTIVNALEMWDSSDRRRETTRLIERGSILMLLRLDAVDSIVDDDYVSFTLLLGFDRDDDCGNNLDGRGSFEIDEASLVERDPGRPRWTGHGFIRRGRFQSTTPFDSILRLPLVSERDLVAARRSRIAMTLRSDALIVDGNYGGVLDGNEVVSLLAPRGLVCGLTVCGWEALVDIELDGNCGMLVPVMDGGAIGDGGDTAPDTGAPLFSAREK